MEKIQINKDGANAVEAYLEYRRIVGDEDGGKVFSEGEYKKYKETVVPRRMQNRLYVSFCVQDQLDCKLIGPETHCFCAHRYKEHHTDFESLPAERPILLPCRVKGCQCASFEYVPINGSKPVRCRCKHRSCDHSEAAPHLCKKCSLCVGYGSPFTCGCGQPAYAHQTLVETRKERMARGRPVGREVPYAAMGGLTGFSSLLDGYLRLDRSVDMQHVQHAE
ncbi:hypothetical protein DNTS_005573 [Danionella cerebrum]|uniref:Protein FAM221A n=1 Tax=Danionella cerebrum TaxID=2873325 RepID=A0A553NJV5_9TELE|nr:hypothetical protein DNTS_005573 [Danionella translucida]